MSGFTRGLSIALAAIVLTVAVPAIAQVASLHFRLSGRDFTVPTPEGLCAPAGPYAPFAESLAAADSANVTNLSLLHCEDMRAQRSISRWALIKTPRPMVDMELTRTAFLADVASLPASELNDLVASDEIRENAEKDLTNLLGARPELSGRIEFAGFDSHAAYFLGFMEVEANGRKVKIAAAYAATVIKGRVIAYYFYELGGEPAVLARVVRLMKAETRRLIAANGG